RPVNGPTVLLRNSSPAVNGGPTRSAKSPVNGARRESSSLCARNESRREPSSLCRVNGAWPASRFNLHKLLRCQRNSFVWPIFPIISEESSMSDNVERIDSVPVKRNHETHGSHEK